MKNCTPETVSDLIDRRLDGAEIDLPMDGVSNNPDLVKNWRNYHLIGDVIRGDVRTAGNCLISRIDNEIASEPVQIDQTQTNGNPSVRPSADNVVSLADVRSGSTPESGSAWKSAGMFAIAASVALVAVLTLNPSANQIDSGSVSGSNVAAAVAPAATPVGATPVEVTPVPVVNKSSDLASFESEFGQMMVEHGEFTATSGLNGLLTYAKLVSNQDLAQ